MGGGTFEVYRMFAQLFKQCLLVAREKHARLVALIQVAADGVLTIVYKF
jgi:hypothetical protein